MGLCPHLMTLYSNPVISNYCRDTLSIPNRPILDHLKYIRVYSIMSTVYDNYICNCPQFISYNMLFPKKTVLCTKYCVLFFEENV